MTETTTISFEDFTKVRICVGTILSATHETTLLQPAQFIPNGSLIA